MQPSDLAEQLRTRLISAGVLDPSDLWNITDEQVIHSYNSCSDCGSLYCSPLELSQIIEKSNSASEFIEGIEDGVEQHKEAELGRLRKRFASKLPAYIVTPVFYISEEAIEALPDDLDDEAYDDVPEERFTITVIRTCDDEVVEQVDYIRNIEEDFYKKFREALETVAESLPEDETVTLIEPINGVPLTACACEECDGFATEFVSTTNYLHQLAEEAEKEKQQRKRKKVNKNERRRHKKH